MINQVVFLCGVPHQLPGLLFKMFLDLPRVQVYYQPLKENLDLWATYSLSTRGDPGIPPGYFDSYFSNPQIEFEKYPKRANACLDDLFPFLDSCINVGARCSVFEISGFEDKLPELLQHWESAKIVAFDKLPASCNNTTYNLIVLKKDEILKNYTRARKVVLDFCGISDLVVDEEETLPSMDWLKLWYLDNGIIVRESESIFFQNLPRNILSKLLLQQSSIVDLGRLEVEVASLKVQLEQVHKAAADRLKVIQDLNMVIEGLKKAADERLNLINQLTEKLHGS